MNCAQSSAVITLQRVTQRVRFDPSIEGQFRVVDRRPVGILCGTRLGP